VSLRCLIVDDSPSVLAVASGLLEREGIVITATAQNIADALSAAAEHRPDFALVDIDLGGESGFELTRRLHPAVPVILISTHAERDFADLIDASPAIGFVAKSKLSAAAIREILNAPRDTR
jgi:two-component system, NarL family, nitrate/nitrite response regulator NarL